MNNTFLLMLVWYKMIYFWALNLTTQPIRKWRIAIRHSAVACRGDHYSLIQQEGFLHATGWRIDKRHFRIAWVAKLHKNSKVKQETMNLFWSFQPTWTTWPVNNKIYKNENCFGIVHTHNVLLWMYDTCCLNT